ncbi:hypothetical protein CBW65_05715 [Tumebacillus avium]|uniref:AAA+ ATPase domain-containing protein n=1 Tax=Tumebacillus avium TaxID=1903704 RepID=A0A1Y0IJJ5_9BACL|nr:ATP-binding protein [Tumebacillus avium]ARU60637.1 hypothetical protein CBW65_05715 [Tumebacillus avium]
MKIKYIYTDQVGPLSDDWSVDLTDDWSGDVHRNILLSGPNGSGKSTVLRLISQFWKITGSTILNTSREKVIGTGWLSKWNGSAIIFENLFPSAPPLVGFIHGSQLLYEKLQDLHPDVVWMGGVSIKKTNTGNELTILRPQGNWFSKWRDAQKKLLLVPGEPAQTPNMIYLNAEDRRWRAPKKRIGAPIPDDYNNRWLTTFQVSDDWQGSIESSLVNLKIVNQKKYEQIIHDLNRYLVNKQIDPVIHEEDNNRLRVILSRANSWHTLDDLSSGEHQVLILLYLVSRWMEPGGIVLIDEPDLHLHPSLINGMLGQLENIVKERDGQLIITSHNPDIWERYDTIGKRVMLGGS